MLGGEQLVMTNQFRKLNAGNKRKISLQREQFIC